MTFDYIIFCKNLKTLREMAGYSKYQMSIQANIQYQYYCNIENGNRTPNFKVVISIANALNVDLSYLLNEKSDDNSFMIEGIKTKLSSVAYDKGLLKNFYDVLNTIKTQVDTDYEGI